MSRARARGALALLAGASALLAFSALVDLPDAGAQRLDPRRPAVFVVGPAGGAAPTMRSDARRSGSAKAPLPSGLLRIAWRKTIGLSIEHPALSGPDGTVAVVTARGDVVFLDADGAEVAHVTSGASSVGPATITSDGTVVFTTSAGDAVGVRRASPRPRFVTRIGGERNARAAPLSLDDGGVVVATTSDLVVLDAEGNVRARVSLPEPAAAPLLAAGDRVVAVTSTGAVFGWIPGREPVRLGSFGAPVDGGAALADATTLLAVIEGNHLVELDLTRGSRTTRSIAAQGLYLGPPSVRATASAGAGPDAGAGAGGRGAATLATVLAMTPTRLFVATVDPGGQELARAPIGVLTPVTLPDGGAVPLVAPLHVGPLVDARGAVAFAATDGHVGMVTADGAVDTIGELICTRSGSASGIAGLTPYEPGSYLVTCSGGAVARISGVEPPSLRRPSPASTSARPASPRPTTPADGDGDGN